MWWHAKVKGKSEVSVSRVEGKMLLEHSRLLRSECTESWWIKASLCIMLMNLALAISLSSSAVCRKEGASNMAWESGSIPHAPRLSIVLTSFVVTALGVGLQSAIHLDLTCMCIFITGRPQPQSDIFEVTLQLISTVAC